MNPTTAIPTGIQGLDAQLGGGIPSGTNLAVLADPSNSPYVFNEQFAGAGLDQGEEVIFYSLERPEADVLKNIKAFTTKDFGKRLQFLDCYSTKLKQLPPASLKRLGIENHAVNVTQDVLDRLVARKTGQPFRVIIESLSAAIQAYGLEPTLTMLRVLTGLVNRLDGASTYLLVKGIHDKTVETMVRHLSDGVLEFGLDRQGFGLYTYISISKMRGIPDATRLLLYKETEKGLWLESTRRVF